MAFRSPITDLPTHQVENQPQALPDYNALAVDQPLLDALQREAGPWVTRALEPLGEQAGSVEYAELGFQANEHLPRLRTFDRYGRRVDEVEFHPAYHAFMRLAIDNGWHAIGWERLGEGGQVAAAAALYLMTQPEQGFTCPVTMTQAVIPALRQQPDLAAEWEPRVLAHAYDPRCIPPEEKAGVTFGMAMTEKQGGSDVRQNATAARPQGNGGSGGEYRLTGHKWFCSAPMSDAFLTLAQSDGGLSCFLVPRWCPDGERNRFFIQRLKDKLGNKSNASSEIEYHDTWGLMVGPEGQGVKTIIEMVTHSRLDSATAPVGMMRHALVQALHHSRSRKVFGKRLIEQPLMRNVLADMALEVEAATAMVMRLAGAFDRRERSEREARFLRVAVPVTKFWTNKRMANFTFEAMECLGGIGYVEENVLPRLYREAPVNSIWEGSGNVLCLDVLRAAAREPESLATFIEELEQARGAHRAFDARLDALHAALAQPAELEPLARRVTEQMAVLLQASLLLKHGPTAVGDAFVATRLAGDGGFTLGTLPANSAVDTLLERAWPV